MSVLRIYTVLVSVLIWALAAIFAGAVLGFVASLVIPFKPQAT